MNRLLLSTLLAVACTSVWAADPPVIALIKSRGVHVVRSFPGPGDLTGWITKDDQGQEGVLFSSKDGNYLFSGVIMDAHGADAGVAAARKYVSDATLKNTFARFLNQATLIGPASAPVTFAVTPDCLFLRDTLATAQALNKQGIQVNWLVFAPSPTDPAAQYAHAILSGKLTLPAFVENQATFLKRPAPSYKTAASEEQLKVNSAMAEAIGLQRTNVAVIVKNKKGDYTLTRGLLNTREISILLQGS